jgi:hypothetical protein
MTTRIADVRREPIQYHVRPMPRRVPEDRRSSPMFRRRPVDRAIATVLAAWLVTAPLTGAAQTAPAQTTPAASSPAAPAEPTLNEARELIKSGDYDHAIEILKGTISGTIEHERRRPEVLRDGYLLLIMTYTYVGNDFKSRPQGRELSNLNYKAARDLITAALETKELRHLKPEPASDYPPEMVQAFADVRAQIFGSFRVTSLDPANAVVTFDGDTLRSFPGDSVPGDVDLNVGKHLVLVRAEGRKDISEDVMISPNSTLERSYEMSKAHGTVWYASWAAGGLAVVGGLVAMVAGKKDTTPPPDQPLPGAPPPPTGQR